MKNLSDIELAYRVVEEIKILDSSIISIEQLMSKLVDNPITLTLKLEGRFPKKDSEKESILDEDGSLKDDKYTRDYSSIFSMVYGTRPSKSKEPEANTLLTELLEDKIAYQIISTIYQEKIDRRKRCIKKLQSFGIEI